MAEKRALHIGVDGRELLGQPTGVGRYLREVLRQWTTPPGSPHRISVFLPSEPAPDLRAATPGVQWRVEASANGGTRWEQMRLPQALVRERIDVLFAAGYTAPVRRVCPFVVAIYDVSFFAHPEWFRWREGLRRRWLTGRAARKAASVMTISEFSAAEIVRWIGIGRERIVLAPPGAPGEVTDAASTHRDPVVLFVGSLFNRRHIPDLLHGFARAKRHVPGARLILVGDNRTNPPIDPIALAASLHIADSVEWRQYVTDAELNRLYGTARVFAFLSDYEGFAMTPLEAVAHGVPIVLLDTAVSREVYADGARLIAPAPDVIGDTLAALLSDDAAHRTTLEAGRRRLAAFSWSRTAATIQHALEKAARRDE